MSEIIFVDHFPKDNPTGIIRPSYVDVFNMVDLWGYKRCGYREVDYQSDNIYICTFKDGTSDATFSSDEAKARKCKIVLWQLEWGEWKDGSLIFPEWAGEKYNLMFEFLWADEIWFSDKWMHQMVGRFNPKQFNRCRYVFLGGHPDFGISPEDKAQIPVQWEAVHLSYLTGMRGQKYEFMRQVNGNNFWGPNGWGDERHRALAHARYGVNLHQGQMPVITPQRFMFFASYSLPILTDYCGDPSPYMVFQDALNHFEPSKTSVANKELREEAVRQNYDLVTKWKTFKSEVDEAAKDLLYDQAIQKEWGGQWDPEQIEILKARDAAPMNLISPGFLDMSEQTRPNPLSMSPDDQAMAKMNEERSGA